MKKKPFLRVSIFMVVIGFGMLILLGCQQKGFANSGADGLTSAGDGPDLGVSKVVVSENVEFYRNVTIGSYMGRDLKADIYLSTGKANSPRPAIVFLHGGGWSSGSPSQFDTHAYSLASKYGFVTVGVYYRLLSEEVFPAPVQDGKCAVRWLRSKAEELNIDVNRIAISGGSAGGHLAALIAATDDVEEYEGSFGHSEHSSAVNAVILFNPVLDLVRSYSENIGLRNATTSLLGASLDANPDKYYEASPMHTIREGLPPFLIMHGTADAVVSHTHAVEFHNKLLELGVHSELELYEGKGHSWFNSGQDRIDTILRMEEFLVHVFGLSSK
jgi:acetyl esterase/lipase